MSTTTGTTSATAGAKPIRKRRAPVRHEGERFRVALTNGGARLSFALSPSATGYTLRARNKSKKDPSGRSEVKIAVEHFAEAQYGDSFSAAKKRIVELVAKATAKGWTEKKSHRSAEDLL